MPRPCCGLTQAPSCATSASLTKSPLDRDVPEIGDELAVCRALNGIAHDLLDATILDVEQNDPASHEPVISIE